MKCKCYSRVLNLSCESNINYLTYLLQLTFQHYICYRIVFKQWRVGTQSLYQWWRMCNWNKRWSSVSISMQNFLMPVSVFLLQVFLWWTLNCDQICWWCQNWRRNTQVAGHGLEQCEVQTMGAQTWCSLNCTSRENAFISTNPEVVGHINKFSSITIEEFFSSCFLNAILVLIYLYCNCCWEAVWSGDWEWLNMWIRI